MLFYLFEKSITKYIFVYVLDLWFVFVQEHNKSTYLNVSWVKHNTSTYPT